VPAARTARGAAGHFALRLGSGEPADITVLAGKVAGGSIYADVIVETDGTEPVAKKHLGPTKYEGFALSVGLVMSKELFEWLRASWGLQPPEKDGAVLALDHQLTVKAVAGFTDSLVTETTFPALDAASKSAGHVIIRVQPAAIQFMPGSGKLSLVGTKQKLWRLSNFRLDIDGLDCKHVSRIESFTVRRDVLVEADETGVVNLVPRGMEFPNLRITLAQAFADTWYDWHEQFVVEGNNDEGFERDGALSFLSADLKAELTRIELHHLGIVRLVPAEDQPTRVTADLYCEEMVLVQPQSGGVA
jgi:hypothetical protein